MKCELCNEEILVPYGSGRFCSSKCARSFATKEKRKEINEKVSLKLTNKPKNYKVYSPNLGKGPLSQEHKQNISLGVRKYYKEKGVHKRIPTSILNISRRTVRKILSRLNLPCSRCGWKEGIGDIHHIKGKKIDNPDNHENLTYICPNCHRLLHSKKIESDSFIPISKYIGDRWKEYYYGFLG